MVSIGPWAYRYFAPPIESYADILLNRVIPIFDDVDGEQERASDEVISSSGWGPDDYEHAIESAYEIGIDRALQFMELRSVFLATGVSGLFHLFEKQLYKHVNRELDSWLVKPINNWNDARSIFEKLTYKMENDDRESTELSDAFSDPNLSELRLVANAVKHGDGRSLEQLNSKGAAVVNADRLENDWTVGAFSILNVSIAILPEDVERYRDAFLRFWGTEGTYWAPRESFPA
jgi:hypothetical protein